MAISIKNKKAVNKVKNEKVSIKKGKVKEKRKIEKVSQTESYRLLEGVYLTDTSPKQPGYLGVLIQLSELGRDLDPLVEEIKARHFYDFLEAAETKFSGEVSESAVTDLEEDLESLGEKDGSSRIEVKFL